MLERIERDTELGSRNEELRLENARVEEVAQARALFLANMSHEIRTPMTAILGYIELVSDRDVSDPEREMYTEIIRRNGRHLLDLINDILDLSKIESGRLDVERVTVQLADVVFDAAETVRVRAAEKGLNFAVEFEGALPESIESDPTRLRQILTNLLGNAVKFTREGSVELRIRLVEDEGDAQLEFEVRDTGIGIALGLAICRRLADRLGGGVRVSSEPGSGSSFVLRIDPGPIDRDALVEGFEPRLQESETEDAALLSGSGRVLLAEDGVDNQRLIRAFLERAGYRVEVVATGVDAVAAGLDSLAREEPFDLILMDIHMPQLDGYGATRQLRSAGYSGPIVALTARAMKGEREECLAAGCDDYASKPIERARLLTLAEKYTRSQPSSPSP
jgi:CheY-like chemotaxis protein